MNIADEIGKAARLIRHADGLLITAGAGIGVDSGLPDFRGNEGFWRAYPPLAKARVEFVDIASPAAFRESPGRAWGFYGHRLQLYRATIPHAGFAALRDMAAGLRAGAFVFTSNVDGQFQQAGFDERRIVEYHGSIHYLQCMDACGGAIWTANHLLPEIDADTCTMRSALPRCAHCGRLARPNILMFNDSDWVERRMQRQYDRLEAWLATVQRLVIIEIGAGVDIPSLRRFGEQLRQPLIRINPRAPEVGRASDVSLPVGALGGLRSLRAELALPGSSRGQGFGAHQALSR
jgi:NAD-dependent SIR2 family protein deacetylase